MTEADKPGYKIIDKRSNQPFTALSLGLGK